jgi:hypothetical protein
MKKSRFSEEQIAYTLKLAEAEYVNKDVAVFEKNYPTLFGFRTTSRITFQCLTDRLPQRSGYLI